MINSFFLLKWVLLFTLFKAEPLEDWCHYCQRDLANAQQVSSPFLLASTGKGESWWKREKQLSIVVSLTDHPEPLERTWNDVERTKMRVFCYTTVTSRAQGVTLPSGVVNLLELFHKAFKFLVTTSYRILHFLNFKYENNLIVGHSNG